MKRTVFIDVRHMDFWYGYYGFSKKTSWEDLIIYDMKNDVYEKLAWTCVCSKAYFEHGLEDLEKDPSEAEFVEEIKEFLEGNQIVYRYYYDNPNDEDFFEVPYEAKRDLNNVKPRSVETWYPGNGIGLEEAKECTIDFCKKFLNIDIDEVVLKDVISEKDTLESYVENQRLFSSNKGVKFSDELVDQLGIRWKKSKEEVIEILNRSI